MSVIEVINPKFDEFQGEPMVTWREKGCPDVRVTLNLYEQYGLWKSNRAFGAGKYKLPEMFWQSRGPAICRALRFCGAKALVFNWTTDRKVQYLWFMKKPSVVGSGGVDYYYILLVHAESSTFGSDVSVRVELPHNEMAHFDFVGDQMKEWERPEVSEDQLASGA